MGRNAPTLLKNTDINVSGKSLSLASLQLAYHYHHSLGVAGPSRIAQAGPSRQGAVEPPYTEKKSWYIEVPSRMK